MENSGKPQLTILARLLPRAGTRVITGSAASFSLPPAGRFNAGAFPDSPDYDRFQDFLQSWAILVFQRSVEYFSIKFVFPVRHRSGDRQVTTYVDNGAQHIQWPVKRQNKADNHGDLLR